MTRLIAGFDQVQWDRRTIDEIADDIERTRPLWLRVANFWTRTIELLRALEPPRLVLWKIEYWGDDTGPFDPVPRSPGVDPARYAAELLSLGHHVVPYVFLDWNRHRLRSLVPALAGREVAVLPIAQRPTAAEHEPRAAVRNRLGVAAGELVLGAGGLLHPAKGIEQIVAGFLRTHPDPDAHLVCSLVTPNRMTAGMVRERWAQEFGPRGLDRVHIRAGDYGDWRWMCSFYGAVDLMLVNSVSESWCRMVSEPVGFGVPTLVRRVRCATNHLVPGLTLVDGFATMRSARFVEAVELARRRAPRLAAWVNDAYSPATVRELFLDLMHAETPRSLHGRLADSTADPAELAGLDELALR